MQVANFQEYTGYTSIPITANERSIDVRSGIALHRSVFR